MPKDSNQSARAKRPSFFYDLFPWECRHHSSHSDIVAYIEASGQWEAVATILPTTGANAADLANFMIRLVNQAQESRDLLQSAMTALELCLQEAKLTFSAEQAADSVLHRIRKARL